MNNSLTFIKQNLFWSMFTKNSFFPLKFPHGFYSIIYNFSLQMHLQKCQIISIDSNIEVDLK